jgi:CheY-like chemotaxis protein
VARVLIVEDDDDIRDFAELLLAQAGHQARSAQNGRVALGILDEGFSPELILLDMRMPVMDGWAFARAYDARPGERARLIVVTAARDACEWASQVGADGYLAKPFELDDLLATANGLPHSP